MTTADFDSAKKGPVEGPVEGLEELDLLAFRYIAEELSDDERGAFELRLADDQGAREAVARAVELSQASLAALEMMEQELPEPIGVAPREVSGWYTRILWMTSGAVACLVWLVGYQFATSPAQLAVNP